MNNPQAPKRKKQGVKSGQHRKLKRSIKIRKLTISITKNVICMEQCVLDLSSKSTKISEQ